MMFGSCATAQNNQQEAEPQDTTTQLSSETIIKNIVPDSIVSIISNAKKISCELYKQEVDSDGNLSIDTVYSDVPKDMNNIVKYLFFNEENFETDNKTRGLFGTWTTICFTDKKGKTARLGIDFGIWKWQLLDDNGKVICQKDLTDRQFFRLVMEVFPNEKSLKEYYELLKKQ